MSDFEDPHPFDPSQSERIALGMVRTLYTDLGVLSRGLEVNVNSIRRLVGLLRASGTKNADQLADFFAQVADGLSGELGAVAEMQDRIRDAGMAPE